MKVSIITVVFNGEAFLEDCIRSVLGQDYNDIEYIIVDGGSTDNSLSIIRKFEDRIHTYISEKDNGMYDALNKGIKRSTGDVVGILNADDLLASSDVITAVVNRFEQSGADGVYGNLNYVDAENTSKVIRRWIAKPATATSVVWGWMPAHPTFYVKRELFEKYGYYSLNFGSAADYELMVRFLYQHHIRTSHLNKLMVNMRNGGMSNASFKHRYRAFLHDYKALLVNKIPFPAITIFLKKISKLSQFVH